MTKYVALCRVKTDAKTRVHPGEVVDLKEKDAAPLLAAGALEPYAGSEAEAKAKAEAQAEAQAKAEAEAKAKAALTPPAA
jgi:membrane protein involved in colicin uptake